MNMSEQSRIQSFYESTVGVETEQNDEKEEYLEPFDPEKISIETRKVSMDTCLRRLQQGTLVLNPDFQRQEVWTLDKKSQLIESLMLNIPIPMFYVSSDALGVFTVVDGLQRLSTIRDYVLGQDFFKEKDPIKKQTLKGKGFCLKNLEFWRQYEGLKFTELPEHLSNRILETEFTFTIINPSTPEEVKRNIFKRINTGGLPLSPQEIRNALYGGSSTRLLNKMSKMKSFLMATDYSIKSLRMEDKEVVLRFLAFTVRSYTNYRRSQNVDDYLADTMLIINSGGRLTERQIENLAKKSGDGESSVVPFTEDLLIRKFEIAMTRGRQLFGRHAFRKSHGNNHRSPINKSLFETWGVLLSEIPQTAFEQLCRNKEKMMPEYIALLDKKEFQQAISRNSMTHQSEKYRFEQIKQLIERYSI